MTQEEKGCWVVFSIRVREYERFIRHNYGIQRIVVRKQFSAGERDFNDFMNEPIRWTKVGNLNRSARQWTEECWTV